MAKKINFKGISAESKQAFSAFINAEYAMRALKEKFKADNQALEDARSKVLSDRKEYLEKFPHNEDDSRLKFSTVEIDAKIAYLREEYLKACKPYKEEQRPALKLVVKDLYYGYLSYMATGSDSAKVSATVSHKNKGALVEEKVNLDKSYHDLVVEFLKGLGLDYSESVNKTQYDRAISKFGDIMVARTAGVLRNNKDFELIKNKSERQYDTIWVLAFIDYLCNTLEVCGIVQNKFGKYELVMR